MSNPPLPSSAESGLPEYELLDSQTPADIERNPGATDLLTVLRDALADESTSADAIFHAAADTAQVLTGAHAIAIALQTDGVVVCRARSGDIAPELGSTLNVDSGISGECFRTSRILRCDDTQTDDRVDPEVCRVLGIRSITVIPLRDSVGVIGILEAVSNNANAFADEQINFLKSLGEIVEAAYRRRGGIRKLPPVVTSPVFNHAERSITLAAQDEEFPQPMFHESFPKAKHHHWILVGAVAMLLLASAVVWWTWHEPASESVASQSTLQAHPVPDQTSAIIAPKVPPSKPSPRVAEPNKFQTKSVLKNAAKVEAADDADTAGSASVARSVAPPASSKGAASRSVDESSTIDPSTVVLGTANNSERLTNLASAPELLPALDVKVSQGVTPANVIRKIEPIYPPEAFAKRLGGSVTLEASVAEDGSVGEVKVVQGEPILATAAVAAVRQWRYSPCLLNGKPIAVKKGITVIFKIP